jgi:hypothetical protein
MWRHILSRVLKIQIYCNRYVNVFIMSVVQWLLCAYSLPRERLCRAVAQKRSLFTESLLIDASIRHNSMFGMCSVRISARIQAIFFVPFLGPSRQMPRYLD